MAVKRAVIQVERDPWRAVRLDEFGFVVMSIVYYEDLMNNLRLLEEWTDKMQSQGDG